MGVVIEQYEVFLIEFDPTKGHEMQKTRPCLIISPDEMNRNIGRVIVAPMTTKSHDYPTRVKIEFDGKLGWIVLDQIRTLDKQRLIKKLGKIGNSEIGLVKDILRQMLVD